MYTHLPAPAVTPRTTTQAAPPGDQHTCTEGPLCAAWWLIADPDAALAALDCQHESCMQAMTEGCTPCLHDGIADALAGEAAAYLRQQEMT